MAKPADEILDDFVVPAFESSPETGAPYDAILARIPDVIWKAALENVEVFLPIRESNALLYVATALTMDFAFKIILRLKDQRDEAYKEIALLKRRLARLNGVS